jgi:hypothetical protein
MSSEKKCLQYLQTWPSHSCWRDENKGATTTTVRPIKVNPKILIYPQPKGSQLASTEALSSHQLTDEPKPFHAMLWPRKAISHKCFDKQTESP